MDVAGAKVWVRDPAHAWIQGAVSSRENTADGKFVFAIQINNQTIPRDDDDEREDCLPDSIKVCSDKGEVSECMDMFIVNEFEDDRTLADIQDLTWLTHLHEPSILQALSDRFFKDEIYTNTGPILLAVNPFQKVNLYGREILDRYHDAGVLRSQGFEAPLLAPHVYATGDSAYRSLIDINAAQMTNQSILVSGESGAGKTESTKYIMKYLATVACDENDTEGQKIADMVLQSNPILEAFGNARTIRNDNSSRFGKFIEMQFNKKGMLIGARIKTYLLEKVRLAKQGESERNYHVFYQLARGASEDQAKEWQVPELESCGLLNRSGCYDRKDGVEDDEQFSRMWEAMNIMGFPDAERSSLMKTVSAVMNLGNLKFENSGDEGSVVTGAGLKVASDLLGVSEEGLSTALTTRKIKVGLEFFTKPLSVEDAKDANEALVKSIYSQMFDRIVLRVNESIQSKSAGKSNFIGVLDIFGFEVFNHNSFEQLCINYANETLQQQFNQFVFKLEQLEYEKEKIKWSFIDFPDNQKCLDLIEAKPIGILSLLDEQCLFPKGNDKSLAGKLYEMLGTTDRFSVSNKERVVFKFTVEHYAGNVCYDTLGFVQKNKDQLYEESRQLMQTTSSEFLSILFPKTADATSRSIQQKSVGSQFKSQLAELLKTIKSTSPHYIRCLKPNDNASPRKLVRQRLVDQLRYGGVLEAVKVARAGYPVRMVLVEFVKRYFMLGTILKAARQESESRHATLEIIEACELKANEDYQVGKTKLFMRKGAYERLEDARLSRMKASARNIQKVFRGKKCLAQYNITRRGVVRIQAMVRVKIARLKVELMRRETASLKLQTVIRRFITYSKFRRYMKAVLWSQAHYRGSRSRMVTRELKKTRAILLLQSWKRGLPLRLQFIRIRFSIILIQSLARKARAKKMLRVKKHEAREVGSLQSRLEELQAKVRRLEGELAAGRGIGDDGMNGEANGVDLQAAELYVLQEELRSANALIQSQIEEVLVLRLELGQANNKISQQEIELADSRNFKVAESDTPEMDLFRQQLEEAREENQTQKSEISRLRSLAVVGATVAVSPAFESSKPENSSFESSAPSVANIQDGGHVVSLAEDAARIAELESELIVLRAESQRADELEQALIAVNSKIETIGTPETHSHIQHLERDNHDLTNRIQTLSLQMCDSENRANEYDEDIQRLRKSISMLEDKRYGSFSAASKRCEDSFGKEVGISDIRKQNPTTRKKRKRRSR